MTPTDTPWHDWIGREEQRSDTPGVTPVAAMSATLDRDDPAPVAGVELPQQTGPAIFDAALLKAGLGFKQAKQSVVDAFEIAYLTALMSRNDGNITRSAQEAGLTRYHLRELLKRHGLKGGDQD